MHHLNESAENRILKTRIKNNCNFMNFMRKKSTNCSFNQTELINLIMLKIQLNLDDNQ